jgi:polyhydroxyalkanoate synthesis regulator phasin
MADLQDIYIIFKDDVLYEDANETLFTWIINNANVINGNGFYVKVIELDDSNIDKIAALNVKTLPALFIDSEVKTYGGNKIREYIKKMVTEGNIKKEETKKTVKPIKKVESSSETDMNDWILEQLNSQGDDDEINGKSHVIEEPMEESAIMRKTQEMRARRDAQTKTTAPKRAAYNAPRQQVNTGPEDEDDLLLDKMFSNQELSV